MPVWVFMSPTMISMLCLGMLQTRGDKLIVEVDDVLFITGIDVTVAWNDCCVEVAVKWSTHHS